jgi:uncharacterized protein YkwD
MRKLLLATSLLVGVLAHGQELLTRIRPTRTYAYRDSVNLLVKNPINFDLVNKELINLINDYRVKNKLSKVALDPALYKATQLQSLYMSKTKIFSHNNPGNGLFGFDDRIIKLNGKYDFKSINNIIVGGECIAKTSVFLSYNDNISFAIWIFELLKNSAPHNKILLDKHATRIAVSISRLNIEDNLYTCLILS